MIHILPTRRAGTPRWAADGGNGRVVPMNDEKVTSDRDKAIQWLAAAIRRLGEDDYGIALALIRYAEADIEKAIQDQYKD